MMAAIALQEKVSGNSLLSKNANRSVGFLFRALVVVEWMNGVLGSGD